MARHGEVRYDVHRARSVGGCELTDHGCRQVSRLVEEVRSRRIAAVYSSRMERAVKSAELAASQLGLRPVIVDGLEELSSADLAPSGFEGERTQQPYDMGLLGDLRPECLGATDANGLVKRFTEAVGHIADIHRGETVLVFTHGGPMSLAIPRLAVNVGLELAGQCSLPNCAVAEVEIDADGWRLVSWPSVGDRHPI